MRQLAGFLRLMRPANIVTAIADILAGISIAGYFTRPNVGEIHLQPVFLLVLSTIGLYGGGVVFNDVFDAELDQVERPERPIPSGLIKKERAALLAAVLLLAGIVCAALVHQDQLGSLSTLLAIAIAIAAVVYDKWGKHHTFLGPVNMGLCRGLNLLLGVSIIPTALTQYWFIGLVPVIYIAAITMISRGEVHGGSKSTLYAATFLYFLVIGSMVFFSFWQNTILYSALFLLLLCAIIFPPLKKAISKPEGPLIGKAVKAGILALIVMNAGWAAAFGAFYLALLILLLLPISIGLAKLFAVT